MVSSTFPIDGDSDKSSSNMPLSASPSPIVDNGAGQAAADHLIANFAVAHGAAPASAATKSAASATSANLWVVNPLFDTLFVFGGMLWLLFAVQIFFFHFDNPDLKAPGPAGMIAYALSVIFFIGNYLFADSHTIATYMRIYSTEENRQRFKLYAYYLPWCSAALFIACLSFPQAAGLCVYLHMMWVFQHYVGQTFGISLIYCYKRNYFLNTKEREIYRWFMHSFSFFIITRILCFREFSPLNFFGIRLPFFAVPPIFNQVGKICFIVMAIAFTTMVVLKFCRDKQLIPVPTLALIFTILGIGLSTGFANSLIWLYGPPFFHGSQYLAVSLGFYLKERGLSENRISEVGSHLLREFVSPAGLRYWAMVIMAGIALYVGIPHVLSYYGFQIVIVATIIQACVNFHHFVTDAAVWRLRDPVSRKVLLA
ncbi:MAG: hypothetical protein KGS72_15675 [Cyanobacteria bacterium REEB67]|nr:hypothetical protein [Cyanobacteria bacterium REEB67]